MPETGLAGESPGTPQFGSEQDPRVGQLFAGKYKILGMIARGGMGRIYRAEQHPIGRIVAVKVLDPRASADDPQFEKRFLNEAATLGKLKHANTVTVFDSGRVDDVPPTLFMAMEFIEGRTLADVLAIETRIEPGRAIRVVREIVRSLREAHALGIVHRDLKPRNVMITRVDDGEGVKVLDFGIAKLVADGDQGMTMADNIVGSPKYMAPEQIRHLAIDPRTDVYALGVLLYEMIGGRVPFEANTVVDTLMAHLNTPPPPIAQHCGVAVDERIEAIIRRCLEKSPEARYATVDELNQALQSLLGEASDSFPSMPTLDRPEPHPVIGAGAPPLGMWAVLAGTPLLLVLVLWVAVWASGILTPAPPAEPIPVVIAPPPTEPAPIPRATLTLRSNPPGAEIYEGNVMIGNTPLELPIEPAGASRTFTIEKIGYLPSTWVQAPTTTNTAYEAALVPAPAGDPPPKARSKPPDEPPPPDPGFKPR